MDKDVRGKEQPASSRLHDLSTGSGNSGNNPGLRDQWTDEGTIPGEPILDGVDLDDEGPETEE